MSWQRGGTRAAAYRRNARGPRDSQAFERIRLDAGELFAAGRSQAEVAHHLGVSRQNASRWHARWRSDGQDALAEARAEALAWRARGSAQGSTGPGWPSCAAWPASPSELA
jgi:hypothetical protein